MIKTLTTLEDCKRAWEAMSPGQSAWDEWELMFAFHDDKVFQLNFLVHESEGQINGLIPLVHNIAEKRFELFGGSYPDSRVLWLKVEDFPLFFEQLPEPTVFFDLKGPWVDQLLQACPQFESNLNERDHRYFLKPAKFEYDFVNHINTFSSEKRKGFLYDLRKIREKGPVLTWSQDDESDFFIDLCNKRFGAESDYVEETGKSELRRVIRELRDSGHLQTLVIEMDGSPQAVSMSAHFGDTMIALYAASNMDYKNLGKLLNVETIQQACHLRADEINYMTGMTWKAAWNMDSESVCTFRKPPKTSPEPG